MTLTKLAARIRNTPPWIRAYVGPMGRIRLITGRLQTTSTRTQPASWDWERLKALQDWSVS